MRAHVLSFMFGGFGLFLATFLIGLREGLEASLIVGILAAFLKRANESLKPLIIATVAAVLLSIAVAAGLMLATQALPQAQQEALETVIGVVAVVFVTTMILWMNANARNMKKNLEEEAAESLSKGGALAMAGMAFLAIMKEGFETGVFLVAVFQASSGDNTFGIVGAALGVIIAVVIGYLIYLGGSRFNLKTFFNVTGPFLILIAAGFAANVFRTAHEAGWVNIGQLQVFDFSAVITNDSVVGSLITGMFSIQADPRLIEVIAWFAYLIPVMVIYCWPSKHSFSDAQRILAKRIAAGVCVVVAALMFFIVPRGDVDVAGDTRNVAENDAGVASVQLLSAEGDSAQISVASSDGSTAEHVLSKVSEGELDGMPLVQWEGKEQVDPDSSLPATVTLNQLRDLNGGRVPSGLNTERTPGPFKAEWSESVTYSARSMQSSLLRASSTGKLLATLSGGGISGTKTVSVSGALSGDWTVSEDETSAAESTLQEAQLAADEQVLWWAWIPFALVVAAIGLGVASVLDERRRKGSPEAPQSAAEKA